MSIYYSCGIMVGLPYSEAIKRFSEDDIDRLLDDGVLDSASPWYDAEMKDWLIGKWLTQPGDDSDINVDTFAASTQYLKEYLSETMDGLVFKVYCTQHVT